MLDIENVMQKLAGEGYRPTGPRRAVVEEILGRRVPFTSAELWDAVQVSTPGVGRATVFRTLDLLGKLGVVQRIHSDAEEGRCQAYLACGERHHHHLICNVCGRVTDFEEEDELEGLVREVERRTAFKVEGHRLELVGVCAQCRR